MTTRGAGARLPIVQVTNLAITPVRYRAFAWRKLCQMYEVHGDLNNGQRVLVARFRAQKRADELIAQHQAGVIRALKITPAYPGQPDVCWEDTVNPFLGIAIDEAV